MELETAHKFDTSAMATKITLPESEASALTKKLRLKHPCRIINDRTQVTINNEIRQHLVSQISNKKDELHGTFSNPLDLGKIQLV